MGKKQEKTLRLDRYLANAGAGSRSEVKKYIQRGMVSVNGRTEKRPETGITPEDVVSLGERTVESPMGYAYYILHKPAGYVSATEDPKEKTVMELVPSRRRGLFPVGRLDKDTEGLLLITDDGTLAHRLLAPGKHVEKVYYALVDGRVTEEDREKVRMGVDIGDETPTLPGKLEILAESPEGTSPQTGIRLTIHEGRYHQIKRMMQALGKPVLYLKRLSMGPLVLPEDLKRGECRPLTPEERKKLIFPPDSENVLE
ncbi:MAG: rRNA pseudouridine synthase [Clostridiales bacterium]|nr:rRNA pseudouridine synthase [Clostridiales bacterium]